MKKLLSFNESLKDMPELFDMKKRLDIITKKIYDICYKHIDNLNFESMEIIFDFIFRPEKIIIFNNDCYLNYNKKRKILHIGDDWYKKILSEIRISDSNHVDDSYVNKSIKKIFKEKFNITINVINVL